MDNNSYEERSARKAREEKVKNFHVHIDQDDLAVGERYRQLENLDEPQPEPISSFSDDDVRKQMKKSSRNQAKVELKAAKKQQKYIDRQNRRTFRFIWWTSVAIIGAMIAVFVLVGVNDMLAVSRPADKKVSISIPENPTLHDVSTELKKKGVITEQSFFETYAKLTKNEEFSQGEYKINTNLDYEAIINYLALMTNRTDTINITIPEGLNVQETAALLVKKGVLSGEDRFLELCNSTYFDEDYKFLVHKNDNKRYYKLEGYLFPDTYVCYTNERPELTITRMLDNYENRITTSQYVEGYKKPVNIKKIAKKKKISMDKLLTIASVIQAEAASTEDMYNVSSVIYNRLSRGAQSDVYRLELDSTRYYPYRKKSKIPADERKSFKSSYNTYKKKGLPPGPICNPGMQAIMAALYPNDTSYLYFCHDKDGTPYYSDNFESHRYNLQLAGLL
ncbi:MAG: endolytic transglycosylase MltG [Ruminococcus sp.]|nr:endolytic transglycosylase MltG [Ruminococcus sp.]